MADKRIFELGTTTSLASKFFAVDSSTNPLAEKFDAAQLVTLAGAQTITGAKRFTSPVEFTDATATIKQAGGELTFTDGVTGSKTLAQLATNPITIGAAWQIPYVNTGGTDFSYSSGLKYETGTLTASQLAVSAIAAGGAIPRVVTTASVTGLLESWSNFTFNNSTGILYTPITSSGSFYVSVSTVAISKDGSNNMTFTDPVTGTKTLAQLAAAAITFGTSGQIPYMNVGGTDFSYSSALRYDTGYFHSDGGIKVSSLSITDGAVVMASGGGVGEFSTSSNFKYVSGRLTVGHASVVYLDLDAGTYPWQLKATGDTSLEINHYTDVYITMSAAGGVTLGQSLTLPTGATVDTIETTLTTASDHLATSSAITAAIAAVFTPSLGAAWQIPYMNSGATDFAYSSGLKYETGILTTSALTIQSLAADGALLYSVVATGAVTQSSNLTFNGSTLTVTSAISTGSLTATGSVNGGDVNATGSLTGADLELTTGAVVDTIATTVTNDDTHLVTAGAVFDAIAAVWSPSLGTAGQIPYVNAGATDFAYSGISMVTGVLTVPGGITVTSLSAGTNSIVMATGGGSGAFTTSSDLYFNAGTLTVAHASVARLYLDAGTYAWGLNATGDTSLTFEHYTDTFITLNTTGVVLGKALTLPTGATVDTIETTLTNDDTHIPTSGAVWDAIPAASPWTTDTNGITYTGGNLGIGVASSAAVGIYLVGDSAMTAAIQYTNNQAYSAWTDFPTALPGSNRGMILTNDASVYGANHYSNIQLGARGNSSGGANAWVVLACQSLSTTTHASSFNVLVRGPGVSDYNTVFKAQSGSTYYWMAESTSTDLTHYFRQASTNYAVMGYDAGDNDFYIAIHETGGVTYDNYHHRIKVTQYSVSINGYQNGALYIQSDGDTTSRTASLQLIAASAGDAYVTYRQATGGVNAFALGYDDSTDTFQLNTGTSFTTTGAAVWAIGYTSGTWYINVNQITTSTNYTRWNSANNEFGWYSSDRTFKMNIRPLGVDALDILSKFDPVRFDWKKDGSPEIGWIAQDGVEHIPEMFPKDKSGFYSLNEYAILPMYHKAIQQLKAEIETLKKQLKNEKS